MHQNHQEQVTFQENAFLEPSKQEAITFTREKLAKIKENIDIILNNNEKNSSTLTKIANAWGPLPWWLKALIFIAILIPTIIVAVFTQVIWVILTVAAINALFLSLYVGISLLLDNHFSQFAETKTQLKAMMDGMADLLGNIILSLQSIAHGLGFEVEHFKVENSQLAVNVDELAVQNKMLATQVELFNEQTNKLGEINVSIKANADTLEQTVQNQAELLKKHEKIQEEMQAEHAQHLSQLQIQISELTQIKEDLAKELDSAHAATQVLIETNASLIEMDRDFDKSREAFVSQANGFFDEKNGKLDAVVDGFSNTVTQLQSTTDLFRQTIKEQQALCNLGRANKSRLEELNIVSLQSCLLVNHGVFKTPYQSTASFVENSEIVLN